MRITFGIGQSLSEVSSLAGADHYLIIHTACTSVLSKLYRDNERLQLLN